MKIQTEQNIVGYIVSTIIILALLWLMTSVLPDKRVKGSININVTDTVEEPEPLPRQTLYRIVTNNKGVYRVQYKYEEYDWDTVNSDHQSLVSARERIKYFIQLDKIRDQLDKDKWEAVE